MESDHAGLAEDLSLYSRSNEKSLKGFKRRVYQQGYAGDICTQEQGCAFLPNSVSSDITELVLEITHGGIYTMEAGECYVSGHFPPLESQLVNIHLPITD